MNRIILAGLAFWGFSSALAVTWPTADWIALPCPSGDATFYNEPHNDFPGAPSQHEIDIVGNNTYPAGFINVADPTNIYFRMRVDYATGTASELVWQFLLDVDPPADPDNGSEEVNFSLQVDRKTDDQVEFIAATDSGTGDLFNIGLVHNNVSPTAVWSGALVDYSRFVDTGDGVGLGDTDANGLPDNQDTFVDVAMPWANFTAATGLERPGDAGVTKPLSLMDGTGSGTGNLRVYLTTSNSHIQVTRDVPEACGTAVPEPGTGSALVLGLLALAARRRR